MLTRLSALFLALSLSTTAGASRFAQPPTASEPVADRIGQVDLGPTRAAVREALLARREHNLAAFRAYRKGGVYPHNFIRSGPLNVWIDEEGHLCAAATMIDKDGKHDLVKDTGAKTKYLRLLDVTEGPLLDWMLTSGFTIEEIDRIQAPMIYPDYRDDPAWREQEDARLRKEYLETDAWLVKHAKAGLDSAVTRVMENPALARKLVAGKL